ncbi:hypothetical protein KKB40_00785, partial [Patescibacteria group bacterium]|nr:hypothetical protein [Patescibacteria group bacterium]
TDDLLQDGDIIDTKKCTAINIEYRDYKRERRISLSLEHGNTYSNNLTVGGEKNWIFGTFESLNTIIESVKPQEHWFIKYKKLTSHVVAIWFGFLLYKLFDIILYRHITLIDNPSENLLAVRGYLHQHPVIFYSIQMALFWFQGVFLTLPLMDWILKLWPSVEFDFGPEYKKLERKRRERLGLFFSFFIIPLFVNFVYDLLTK